MLDRAPKRRAKKAKHGFRARSPRGHSMLRRLPRPSRRRRRTGAATHPTADAGDIADPRFHAPSGPAATRVPQPSRWGARTAWDLGWIGTSMRRKLAMCDKEPYRAHISPGELKIAVTDPMPKVKTTDTRSVSTPTKASGSAPLHASVMEEARCAGLLEGEKSEHVSFRAPPALVEAAKREAGISSTSELGVLALAMLARPDPVAAFFRRTEGRLGPDHDFEY